MNDITSGVLFLAPGFLALKLFYLFGVQRVRSQWEWTTWSVISSVPIGVAASLLYGGGLNLTAAPSTVEVANRVVIAVTSGILAACAWQVVRRHPSRKAARLRTFFGSSAWDETLEDVGREKRLVELVLVGGKRYRGTIRYGGREDNEAEGWLYLVHPKVYDDGLELFRRPKGTRGYLIHRDRIERMRIMLRSDEPDPAETNASSQPVA